jgi:hypothetical protein
MTGSKNNTLYRFIGIILGIVFLVAPQAKANQYLFSFTAEQALGALYGTQGLEEQESAYFALFVKPNLGATSFSYNSTTAPSNTYAWDTGTITDPSLGSGAWARFNKAPGSTAITVLSDANNGEDPVFIFENGWFTSNAVGAPNPPIGFGNTNAEIMGAFNLTDVFSFVVDTGAATLSGPYTVNGKASAIISKSLYSFTYDSKDYYGKTFSLTLTPQDVTPGVPEPSAVRLLSLGFLGLIALQRVRSRRRDTRSNSPDVFRHI